MPQVSGAVQCCTLLTSQVHLYCRQVLSCSKAAGQHGQHLQQVGCFVLWSKGVKNAHKLDRGRALGNPEDAANHRLVFQVVVGMVVLHADLVLQAVEFYNNRTLHKQQLKR